ncbi:MAG: hypothetical protein EOP36_01885 [Rubrivivax sp.]|nr:MAG: hypothetical protein EOP36_01885 [Rubrivivax sp.]
METTYVLAHQAAPATDAPPGVRRAWMTRAQLILALPVVLALLLAASGVQALVQTGSTAASPAAHDAPVASVVQATRPTTKRGTPAPPPAEAASQAPWVQRVGDALHVDAQGASRRALVEQLAAATGTQLIGSTSVLDDAPMVSRHWRGRDAMPLLAQLLDGHIDFAALCNAQGCKVWLQASSSPDKQATPTPPPANQYSQGSPPGPPQADPPGLFPSE